MPAGKTRAELFAGDNVIRLCPESDHQHSDIDLAMLNAEKASQIGLWTLTGMVKDFEDSGITEEALEIVRQVIWAADVAVQQATSLYWKAREAGKPTDGAEGTA